MVVVEMLDSSVERAYRSMWRLDISSTFDHSNSLYVEIRWWSTSWPTAFSASVAKKVVNRLIVAPNLQ